MAALIYFAPSYPNPIIAFGVPFQLKSGRTSEPRLPQAEQVKRGPSPKAGDRPSTDRR
jgi:hypothetical protein